MIIRSWHWLEKQESCFCQYYKQNLCRSKSFSVGLFYQLVFGLVSSNDQNKLGIWSDILVSQRVMNEVCVASGPCAAMNHRVTDPHAVYLRVYKWTRCKIPVPVTCHWPFDSIRTTQLLVSWIGFYNFMTYRLGCIHRVFLVSATYLVASSFDLIMELIASVYFLLFPVKLCNIKNGCLCVWLSLALSNFVAF